ncbi:MAG: hypothetical protein IKG79_07220 [Neisseriaceae bacterium]|nr:hypothetical protein [Neisseriaceae bacterium]
MFLTSPYGSLKLNLIASQSFICFANKDFDCVKISFVFRLPENIKIAFFNQQAMLL